MIDLTHQNGVAILSWNLTGQPMNVLNDESIAAFGQALEAALTDDRVRGLVITSARREFIAGADLKKILTLNTAPPAQMLALSQGVHGLLRRLETCGRPVVAALNGTALGGGLEVALACHYRVVLNAPGSVLGLPEVTLGLMPGWGGTQRLPRLLGLAKALPLLLTGTRLSPRQACELGLADALADTPEALLQAAFAFIDAHPAASQPYDAPGYGFPEQQQLNTILQEARQQLAQAPQQSPAPMAILDCLAESLPQPVDAGLHTEARYFTQLATSREAAHIIKTMFFGMNEAGRGIGRPADVPRQQVNGVVFREENQATATLTKRLAQAGIGSGNANATLASVEDNVFLFQEEYENQPVTLFFQPDIQQSKVVEIVQNGAADTTIALAVDFVRQLRNIPLLVWGGSFLDRCRQAGEGATGDEKFRRQAQEAMQAENEGMIKSRTAADVASVLVLGFPAATGGIFSFGQEAGS